MIRTYSDSLAFAEKSLLLVFGLKGLQNGFEDFFYFIFLKTV